jgi:hypothetical protein
MTIELFYFSYTLRYFVTLGAKNPRIIEYNLYNTLLEFIFACDFQVSLTRKPRKIFGSYVRNIDMSRTFGREINITK